MNKPVDTPEWKKLLQQAQNIDQPGNHLRRLLEDRERLERFSLKKSGMFFDYSRQRVTAEIMQQLFQLARKRGVLAGFGLMTSGSKVNQSEGRAALHTALRNFDPKKEICVDGHPVMPEIRQVNNKIKSFSDAVRNQTLKGSTGKPFTDIVVVGIGGSYLGTEFVAHAMQGSPHKKLNLHFLTNVDIDNFDMVTSAIDPASSLWVIISKSYTTQETLANTRQAYSYLESCGLDPKKHVVTVTAKGSPGDDPDSPVLESFYMFDYIGGRYSVTSAVGGVPLSLCYGYESFERFLRGAGEMDIHAETAPEHENMPLIAALLSIWNNNFLNLRAQAIIPYASFLSRLASHIQQLYMESNGKSVRIDGSPLEHKSGVIIFGEPGTNAQHSSFQLAHQGSPFPIDFIGVINPCYSGTMERFSGITNHQELWANLISQPQTLATGRESKDGARHFPGNRPSSTLIINSLSPENIGRLLSFYEARTVFEALIWGINPFDQFGVELGKTNAKSLRKEMAKRNQDKGHVFETDPVSGSYLEMLFKGSL